MGSTKHRVSILWDSIINLSVVVISYVHNLGPPPEWDRRGSYVKYGLASGKYTWTVSARLHTYYEQVS